MMKTREKRFTKKRQGVFHVGGRRTALLLALALGRLALQGAEGYPVMDNDRILLMNNDAKGGRPSRPKATTTRIRRPGRTGSTIRLRRVSSPTC